MHNLRTFFFTFFVALSIANIVLTEEPKNDANKNNKQEDGYFTQENWIKFKKEWNDFAKECSDLARETSDSVKNTAKKVGKQIHAGLGCVTPEQVIAAQKTRDEFNAQLQMRLNKLKSLVEEMKQAQDTLKTKDGIEVSTAIITAASGSLLPLEIKQAEIARLQSIATGSNLPAELRNDPDFVFACYQYIADPNSNWETFRKTLGQTDKNITDMIMSHTHDSLIGTALKKEYAACGKGHNGALQDTDECREAQGIVTFLSLTAKNGQNQKNKAVIEQDARLQELHKTRKNGYR